MLKNLRTWLKNILTRSKTDEDLLNESICPDCKQHTEFWMGPEGGLAQNICCVNCNSAFNVGWLPGRILLIDRIQNDYFLGAPLDPALKDEYSNKKGERPWL